jgi:hypothetical protein
MATLWEKISQKLHAIVDRALEARSMALYDQYVRDVEAYSRQVEESAAMMYAGIQANKRRLARHEADAHRLDGRIDELILAGGEEAARMVQGDLEIQQGLVATTRAQIANQEADYQLLLAGRQETGERLHLVRGERPAVESLLAVVRAGELIEKIELSLGSLARLGEESAAGRVAAGIQRRFDEAETRWQMASMQMRAEQASEEAEKAQVESQLVERMRRLGLDESK